jgi:hypothetical protein
MIKTAKISHLVKLFMIHILILLENYTNTTNSLLDGKYHLIRLYFIKPKIYLDTNNFNVLVSFFTMFFVAQRT